MRWTVLVVVLAVTACDTVFRLDNVGPAQQPTACPGPDLSPGGDYDGDSEPNAGDPCPLVANESMHDEDGDGIPDDCDACPQVEAASEDLDCDGIGAACDPDDTVPQQREFIAFDRNPGFKLDAATLADDQLHLSTAPFTYSEVQLQQAEPSDGFYETVCTLHEFTTTSYAEFGFRFYWGATGADYDYTGVLWDQQKLVLTSTDAASGSIVGAGPISRVRLQATLAGATAHAEISGDVTGSYDGAVQDLPASIHLAVDIYDGSKVATVDCDYVEHIY